MSESDVLLTEGVERNLVKLANEIGLENVKLKVTAASAPGDNFMGIVSAVEITGSGKARSGNENQLNLIVKSMPKGAMIKQLLPIKDLYKREAYIYSKVLKEFHAIEKEFNVENTFKSHATCIDSYLDDDNEAIVMKNKKIEGFNLVDRRKPLNYYHTVSVLKEYGKLHALSFALKDHKPDLFNELSENCRENCFTAEVSSKMAQFFNDRIDKILEALDPIEDEKFIKIFEERRSNCFEKFIKTIQHGVAGEYAVICHGDCWINNILFKYENEQEEDRPSEICLLDWQLARSGSPVLDLSYFLYGCTDHKLRQQHFDNLMNEYYQSFSSFLRQFGSNPEKLFPFHVLQEHWKKFSFFGLQMSFSVLVVVHTDREDIPNFKNMDSEEEYNKVMEQFKTNRSTTSNDRIRGNVLDHVQRGCDL